MDGIADAIGDVVDAVGDIGKGVEQSAEETFSRPLPAATPEPPSQPTVAFGRRFPLLDLLRLDNSYLFAHLIIPSATTFSTQFLNTGEFDWVYCLGVFSPVTNPPTPINLRAAVSINDPRKPAGNGVPFTLLASKMALQVAQPLGGFCFTLGNRRMSREHLWIDGFSLVDLGSLPWVPGQTRLDFSAPSPWFAGEIFFWGNVLK